MEKENLPPFLVTMALGYSSTLMVTPVMPSLGLPGRSSVLTIPDCIWALAPVVRHRQASIHKTFFILFIG